MSRAAHLDKWFFRSVLLAVLAAIGAYLYFIVVVPAPKDVISQQEARDGRQWRELSILKTNQAADRQRFEDFEKEMRRTINPGLWVNLAQMRQQMAEMKEEIRALKAVNNGNIRQ